MHLFTPSNQPGAVHAKARGCRVIPATVLVGASKRQLMAPPANALVYRSALLTSWTISCIGRTSPSFQCSCSREFAIRFPFGNRGNLLVEYSACNRVLFHLANSIALPQLFRRC